MTDPARVVSLVPSVTETIAALGAADRLVGVTDWCAHGAPDDAVRIGGTKSPSLGKVVALRPDLVVANAEENRREDVLALREAGITVLVTFPRSVDDVAGMIRTLGRSLGTGAVAEALARSVVTTAESVRQARREPGVRALTLVWRKPWMALGAGTYAADLLDACGFANVVAAERYPQVDAAGLRETAVDVVLLPSEPYAFGPDDLDAVRDLVGPGPALELVDGRLLTWHGPSTAEALRHFATLRAAR